MLKVKNGMVKYYRVFDFGAVQNAMRVDQAEKLVERYGTEPSGKFKGCKKVGDYYIEFEEEAFPADAMNPPEEPTEEEKPKRRRKKSGQ